MRVLLMSEHVLFRQGLSRVLGEALDLPILEESDASDEGVEQVGEKPPDVILLHVCHPVSRGMRLLQTLRAQRPDVPVVVLLDIIDDEVVVTAMQAGAAGCLDKSVDAGYLAQALGDAATGEVVLSECLARRLAGVVIRSGNGHRQPYRDSLTARELQVVELLRQGLTNREIGRGLFIAESTVRAHVRTLTQKLGANNRVHAVARALELGMVPTSM